MDDCLVADLTRRIQEHGQIPVESIPEIELYMDQLLTFLNHRLPISPTGPNLQSFTKTMINNYTKDRLLIPPKNKKYAQQHILLLILIFNLKGILSISDIKKLFEPILRDITTPDDDLIPLEDIYTTYLDLSAKYLDEFGADFTRKLKFITDKTAHLEGDANTRVAQLFLSVLILVAQANLSKRLAELIIETHFDQKEEAP